MVSRPRYTASVHKALEAVLWLASRSGNAIDIYKTVKAMFFADKWHVRHFGRPILGDHYRAATFGPLGQVVYNLLRHQPLEVLALGGNGKLPFKVNQGNYRVESQRAPNLDLLSESDCEALQVGWDHVQGMSFDDLVAETHGDAAWYRSDGDAMDYRDFLADDDENVDSKRAALVDEAPSAYF